MEESLQRIIRRILEEAPGQGPRSHDANGRSRESRPQCQARSDGFRDPGHRAQAPAVMTSEIDIYRTANVLVKRYGEDANLEAAQRADAMLEKGCLDGQRV